MRRTSFFAYAFLATAGLAASVAPTSLPLAATRFETPPVFSARRVLPKSLRTSPYYTVEDRVGLDHFQYVFKLNTHWGPFTVQGFDLLRLRAHEMAATAKLDAVLGGTAFAKSAGKTALKPLNTARDLVTAPRKTLRNTVRGVGHVFADIKSSWKATDPHRAGLIASITGGAAARRRLAYDFGVDPHTSFPPLSAELTRLATASAVGDTAANAGLSFVTGGAGIAISVGGTSSSLRQALRNKTTADLEYAGRQELHAMGVKKPLLDAFYRNPNLSPTDKAIIVEALQSLGPATNRSLFIASASRVKTAAMGFTWRHQAELIAAYAKRIAPVEGFVRLGGMPMLKTARGIVGILPADYLYWAPSLAALIQKANQERKAGGLKGRARLWLVGRTSRDAAAHLRALGWSVEPHADRLVEPPAKKPPHRIAPHQAQPHHG